MAFDIPGRMSAVSPPLTMVLIHVCDRELLHTQELCRVYNFVAFPNGFLTITQFISAFPMSLKILFLPKMLKGKGRMNGPKENALCKF